MSNIYGFFLSNPAVKARNLVKIESLKRTELFIFTYFNLTSFVKNFKVQGKKVVKV